MSIEATVAAIGRIKKKQENIAVTIGVLFGTILGIYFFTMSELLNRGLHFLVQMQIVTAVLIVIGLIFVRKIAFFVVRFLMAGKAEYKPIFASIVFKDLEQEPEKLAQRIHNGE